MSSEMCIRDRDQTFWQTLQEQRAAADKTGPAPLQHALAVQENGNLAPDTFVMSRGNARALGDQVVPGFPAVLNVSDPVLSIAPVDSTSCGRRTVLANWIASPANRLTSRVIVNRVWQHHFGRGIVSTPDDFGRAGELPSHPQLLDWLSIDFADYRWSGKRQHRHILHSSPYRQQSAFIPPTHALSLIHITEPTRRTPN